jgi:hypothetical protein
MDRSSLPAVKFGRFKPFFIWFPWQIIQVIFSQKVITVPGTVVLIPQLWCQSDPETAKMLALLFLYLFINEMNVYIYISLIYQ